MKFTFFEKNFLPFYHPIEIRDENDLIRYTLTRNQAAVGYKMRLLDPGEQEVALIRQKISLLTNKFTITTGGREILLVTKANRREGFFFEFPEVGWKTTGNPSNEAYLLLSNGEQIAFIQRLPCADGKSCTVEYANAADEVLLLAAAIAIEAALAVIDGADGD